MSKTEYRLLTVKIPVDMYTRLFNDAIRLAEINQNPVMSVGGLIKDIITMYYEGKDNEAY